MKNRILPLFCLIFLLTALLIPMDARASTPLDPDASASLTLHYRQEGKVFPDLTIRIYRVAEAFPDGTFELIEPFASYPINIHDITRQEQWRTISQTLCAYVVADQVVPDREGKTDQSGTVCFSDLTTGLYFVREVIAENPDGTYIFNHFMVYLPTPTTDGTYDYDVEAIPKCTNYVPKSQYTVTKLWQDAGNSAHRPKEVMVDIYKDGILYDSQALNGENNWTYTWYVIGEDTAQWTVAEREVPEHYKVTIQQNGNKFSIINTRSAPPVKPPQTGDTFNMLPWIFGLCFSGMMLMILGIYGRRRRT